MPWGHISWVTGVSPSRDGKSALRKLTPEWICEILAESKTQGSRSRFLVGVIHGQPACSAKACDATVQPRSAHLIAAEHHFSSAHFSSAHVSLAQLAPRPATQQFNPAILANWRRPVRRGTRTRGSKRVSATIPSCSTRKTRVLRPAAFASSLRFSTVLPIAVKELEFALFVVQIFFPLVRQSFSLGKVRRRHLGRRAGGAAAHATRAARNSSLLALCDHMAEKWAQYRKNSARAQRSSPAP